MRDTKFHTNTNPIKLYIKQNILICTFLDPSSGKVKKDLYLYTPIHLHGMVLNKYQDNFNIPLHFQIVEEEMKDSVLHYSKHSSNLTLS
jgi:hypothetical protein